MDLTDEEKAKRFDEMRKWMLEYFQRTAEEEYGDADEILSAFRSGRHDTVVHLYSMLVD